MIKEEELQPVIALFCGKQRERDHDKRRATTCLFLK